MTGSLLDLVQNGTRVAVLSAIRSAPQHEITARVPPLDHNAIFRAVLRAVQRGAESQASDVHCIVRALVDRKCDASASDSNGQTPLFYAARAGLADCVELLVSSRCSVNLADRISSQTALFYAARDARSETARALCRCGADSSHQDSRGQTPIFYACGQVDPQRVPWGDAEKLEAAKTVDILMLYSAQPDHCDHSSKTPLTVAKNADRHEVVACLQRVLGGPVRKRRILERESHCKRFAIRDRDGRRLSEVEMAALEEEKPFLKEGWGDAVPKSDRKWVANARKAVKFLMESEEARPFCVPWDLAAPAYDCGNVSWPTDFSAIMRRLKPPPSGYDTVDEFLDDVDQVFAQPLRAPATHNLRRMAEATKAVLDQQLSLHDVHVPVPR
mmetsp:Transcript_83275/g.222633  ORF Transcript_83275/g.222633 Transcript_83275/m.222633 type:complete len:386 (+) Transcript_83275:12-1169(+)